jgi:asparagine synthase (glutamine-hydrolysing)
MCGFAGFLQSSPGRADELTAKVNAVADTLVNRGPDDSGAWVDVEHGLALGFRRLSIVDLSPEGHQPMLSETSRYVISFNGEIYNFMDLRKELETSGHRWRGHSDTEVLLAAVTEWGVENAVRRFNGMFAFALWDREEKALWLGRDRIGKKPLYYGVSRGTLLFGSELKALAAHPAFEGEIDRSALALFLRFGYVPAPHSIYRGIYKLPPAHLLKVLNARDPLPQPRPYWSATDAAIAGTRNPFQGSDDDAIARLDSLLRDAVGIRMIADVPLGAFLSGGIDSSLVVSLMQAQSSNPVRTFSIGFSEDEFNEAQHAKLVAQHLGTDHTELYVTPRETLDVIPHLPEIYDEPFADSSQVPTFLVSKLARQHVTVALSGDGGDELFAGYHRYFWGKRIWDSIGWIPAPARRAGAAVLRGPMRHVVAGAANALSPVLPSRLRVKNPADKMQKLADVFALNDAGQMYSRLVEHWKDAWEVTLGAQYVPGLLEQQGFASELPGLVQRMQLYDALTYLPDDILVKVDRATMAVSLEGRAPLLDYRVYEFAWSLPMSMKIRDGKGKWILRQLLAKYVPPSLFERPKMGFGVPIVSWLRGPLRDWAEALLDKRRLETEGFFDAARVRTRWEQHLSGERDWQYYLWDVLMFQAWHEHIRAKRSDSAQILVG